MLFIEKLAQSQSVEAPSAALSLAPLQAYVIKNISEDISLDDLSATVGISKFALTRLFHKYYGIAPMRWLWSFRAHLARDIISKGLGLALMDVLTLCGFNSPQHFSRFFRKTFRQAPSSLVKSMIVAENNNDVQKAKQDLYESFEKTVTESLEAYTEKCKIVPINPAAEEMPAQIQAMETFLA
ncbi:MAG: helix-turn-helix transcriptional regulator [Oligoflexus sp.]|nr:helix-turn-helix transcriptional regulator [Oligoflexus sp.]